MVSKALLHTLFWISPRQSLVCHFQRWTVISTCAHTCNSSCLFTTYHSLFYFLLHSCFYFFLPTLQFTEPSCQGKSICLIYKYKYKMYLDLYFFCGILCLFLLLCPLFQHSHLIPFTGWMRLEGPSWSIWSFLVHLCSIRVTRAGGWGPHAARFWKSPRRRLYSLLWQPVPMLNSFLTLLFTFSVPLVLVPSLYKQIYSVRSLHQSVPPCSISSSL